MWLWFFLLVSIACVTGMITAISLAVMERSKAQRMYYIKWASAAGVAMILALLTGSLFTRVMRVRRGGANAGSASKFVTSVVATSM